LVPFSHLCLLIARVAPSTTGASARHVEVRQTAGNWTRRGRAARTLPETSAQAQAGETLQLSCCGKNDSRSFAARQTSASRLFGRRYALH
jgi:hypothetical protein